jgi:hypothetical protein
MPIISWGGDRIKGLPFVHSHHYMGAIRQQDAPEPKETKEPPSGLRLVDAEKTRNGGTSHR